MDRVVCGLQCAREAIRVHGARLPRVCIEDTVSPELAKLERFAGDQGARVDRVRRSELDKLSQGVRHQGVVALAPELVLHTLDELLTASPTLVVALDELEDPQNFGAVIRSAVALGANAIVWPEHRSAPLTPATFRASAGAIEHATLCRVGGLPNALMTMRDADMQIVGLDANGSTAIADFDLTTAVAIVVGAEGKGLRKTVKSVCTGLAKLPMGGPIASLNASVAAAIALYEVVRQRPANQD